MTHSLDPQMQGFRDGELFVKDDRILMRMVSFTELEFFLNLLPFTVTSGFMHGLLAAFN